MRGRFDFEMKNWHSSHLIILLIESFTMTSPFQKDIPPLHMRDLTIEAIKAPRFTQRLIPNPFVLSWV
jgi:hypothetical protein